MSDIESNRYNWDKKPKLSEPNNLVSYESPYIIDLFCGSGGISKGFADAGFDVLLGLDIHEPSIETFKQNHPHAYTILGDIRKVNNSENDDRSIIDVIDNGVNSETLLESFRDNVNIERPTVLAGGIPCQGFSISNKKQDDEDDRNYLFEEFIRAALVFDPKYVLIENVSTMSAAKDGKFVRDINTCLKKMGYTVENKVLDATNYGVPQKRERLFFFGTKGDNITWPTETTDTAVSVLDAIGDLPSLDAAESKSEYMSEPETEYQQNMRADSLTNHSAPRHQQQTIERIKNTRAGEPMYESFKQRIRLPEKEPSPTVFAGGIRPQFQFGHPTESRGLTVRERARLQSFPDSYEFRGGLTQKRFQTGMAVPPRLAQAFAEAVIGMESS